MCVVFADCSIDRHDWILRGFCKHSSYLIRPIQWFLEIWNTSHAVLGLITILAVQRAIHKVLISVFLSREFKYDESDRAWWMGKWYGCGLGAHVLSHLAREFIIKIIELSLWSSDFLIGHFLFRPASFNFTL